MPADTQPFEEKPLSAGIEDLPMPREDQLNDSTDGEDTQVLTASPFLDILTCDIEPSRDVPAKPGKSLATKPARSHMASQVKGAARAHLLPFSHPVAAAGHVRKRKARHRAPH